MILVCVVDGGVVQATHLINVRANKKNRKSLRGIQS